MIRLFVDTPLETNTRTEIKDAPFHYLKNVMRRNIEDEILVFNGQNGEWLAKITEINKKALILETIKQTRVQDEKSKVHLYFALIKKDKVDLIAEKATELNVASINPIITERTITNKTNTERLRLTAIEASEQCERTNIPDIKEPIKFNELLGFIKENKEQIFFIMDETYSGKSPESAFLPFKGREVSFIIGPEGGFTPNEFDTISKIDNVYRVSMGKNILRAETAVIVAIASWHSLCGDFI